MKDMRRKTDHPLYMTWDSMKARCLNRGRKDYHRYGARGIKVCERWLTCFWYFVEDVGPKPSPSHSLDRIDNDGDYEPGNVRWATPDEQRLNSRPKVSGLHLITHQGRTQTISQWASEFGLHRHVLRSRIVGCGWPMEKALQTPVGQRRGRAQKESV